MKKKIYVKNIFAFVLWGDYGTKKLSLNWRPFIIFADEIYVN